MGTPHWTRRSAAPSSASRRGLLRRRVRLQGREDGRLGRPDDPHGLQSFSQTPGVTLHVDVLRGDNDHHCVEAAFKALAVAVCCTTERMPGKEDKVISTKGVL